MSKIILFAFIAAVLAVHSAFAENSASAAKNTGASITITEEALHEFETRKKQLDARERELEEKSKALDLQEKILKEKLKKMEDLNRKMAERLEKYKKDHEDKLAKMVGMVEAMKPQAAAEYVENLDPDLAVEILSRLEVKKAAKILNLADKKKTARLSEMYTGYRDQVDDDLKNKKQDEQQQQSKKEGELNRG